MKKTSTIVLCAGLAVSLTACVEQRCDIPPYPPAVVYGTAVPAPQVVYYNPYCGHTEMWHHLHHCFFEDGYSFNNDPQNHDLLAPALGLDPYFPPAPLPYKSID